MAWTSMHFAIGMCGGAALTLAPCLILRRGWRFIPVGMTLGGLWGLIPDLPRVWREDFPSLPFAATLGDKQFELWLHSVGDLFFFHRSLDMQPREFALLGLAIIIGLYNLAFLGLIFDRRRTRTTCAKAPATTLDYSAQTKPESDDATHPSPLNDRAGDPVVGRIGGDRSA